MSVKPRSMDCSVHAPKELQMKNNEKALDVATSALPPPYTPKAAYINFGMWGRVPDMINHAKFQLDRFRYTVIISTVSK